MNRTSRVQALGWLVVACSIAALASLVACGKSAGEAPRDKLSIAVPTTPHAALLHLARIKGYYADSGLDLSITEATHGKAALDLLSQGRVDLATAAEVPFVIAVLKGEPLGMVATVASVSSEMAVVARKDRNVRTPSDLRGKRVGVTPGTSGEYYLWALMTRHRIPADSVELVSTPPGDMVKMLSTGAVDAVSTWEPVKSAAQAAQGPQAVVFAEPEVYTVTHVLIGRNDFLKSRPDTMKKLLTALIQAERYAKEQPEEALQAVAAWLHVDPKTSRPGWNTLALKVDLRQSQLLTIEDQSRWAMARGYAARSDTPNFLPHIHLEPLLAVQSERVSVVH